MLVFFFLFCLPLGIVPNYQNQRLYYQDYANIFRINNALFIFTVHSDCCFHTCALFLCMLVLLFLLGRLKVLRTTRCILVFIDLCERRSQCKELLTLIQWKAVATAIYTFRHNTHKLVPNMMWWAENAIIMKFTRGTAHNASIHIKTLDVEHIGRRRKKYIEREQILCTGTHSIWFSFVAPSFISSYPISAMCVQTRARIQCGEKYI